MISVYLLLDLMFTLKTKPMFLNNLNLVINNLKPYSNQNYTLQSLNLIQTRTYIFHQQS